MQSILTRISLLSLCLLLFTPTQAKAATEQRSALVIGNGSYSSGPLRNPVNDATDMAATLQKLGFAVILKKNVSLKEMEDAIADFGNRLKRGGVGLFYYAGHGLQVSGVNYLIPIGARIEKESDVKYEAVDAGRILDEMANANNGLNIVVLDACRDNPYSRSFRSASRGLAIVSTAPVGTFISYSTGPGSVASDGESRNSPYTAALLQYMKEPGLTIENVFKKVRTHLSQRTGGKQIPWELSSLQGDFSFMPGHAKATITKEDMLPSEKEKHGVLQEKTGDDELELAMAKMQEKEELFKTLASDIKKYRSIKEADIDETLKERAWQALIKKYPQWSVGVSAKKETGIIKQALQEDRSGSFKNILKEERISFIEEIARDGRFIAYDNGTVLDTKTNLMWASKDNGAMIWSDAKSYCENYRGGGYRDWRMPTHGELAGLYDSSKSRPAQCSTRGIVRITELIDLSCWYVWGSETDSMFLVGPTGAVFSFNGGSLEWGPQRGCLYQALPVRNAK